MQLLSVSNSRHCITRMCPAIVDACRLFKECCPQIVAGMKMQILNEKLEQYVINEKLHRTVCDASFY